MKRMLFVRKFKMHHGGHLTVRDYFLHAMAHPEIEPYMYFTPGSRLDKAPEIWESVPKDRIVTEWRPEDYDLVFVGSTGWQSLPEDLGSTEVMALCLHVRHGVRPALKRTLAKPAYRIANSPQVLEAITPYANGPTELIYESFDFGMFSDAVEKVPRSVFIFGKKNPGLAERLEKELVGSDLTVTSFNDSVAHEEFAAVMSRSMVYAALPHQMEGFFRPPVEAMAAGTAVVCSDAIGTRMYLRPDETCLQPDYDDEVGYARDIRRLIDDDDLRARLVENGKAMAKQFTFEDQQARFHAFLDEHVLA